MRLFDVLGPVMIGPSSSHTAGAARIGYTAQKLLGEIPAQADIGLYGSFATTGKGHGTDKALVAGLLGLRPDDPRLPDSFALAAEQGMAFRIHPVELRSAHPNTAVLTLTGREGRVLSMKAASVGGGRIRVTEIDGVPVMEVIDDEVFYDAFKFDGENGGFEPAAGAHKINCLIATPLTTKLVPKISSIYYFNPGSHTEGDGYLYQERELSDVFTFPNGKDGKVDSVFVDTAAS